MRLTKYFKSGLIGRMAILKGEDKLLEKYAALAGDHVEIGCLSTRNKRCSRSGG